MGKSNHQVDESLVWVGALAIVAVSITLAEVYKQHRKNKTAQQIVKYMEDKIETINNRTRKDLDRCVTPTRGLESMVLAPEIKEGLGSIVHYTKAQPVLNEWGFDKVHRATTGISALFTGPPGTGKTMAAE